MKQTCSILVVTEDLLNCPALRHYCKLHDKVLAVGEHTHVSFLLPMYLRHFSSADLEFTFDPARLEVTTVTDTEEKQVGRIYCKVEVGFIPKELGSTAIGVVAPHQRESPLNSPQWQLAPIFSPARRASHALRMPR